jgi:alkanesulfonate monooxygenase SsuD/methylene tetrahydromethanopterin reductase-like flavin-dependent oxidoreductase (luciferase family)
VLLFGDPGRVIERIHTLQEDLGVTSLLCWTNFGGLPSELAHASIRRFAEKVIPKFR